MMNRKLLALIGGLALVGVASPATLAQDGGKPNKQEKHSEKEHKHSDKEHKEHKQDGKKAGAKIGEPAPAFTLTDTDGKSHSLADLKGKVVVLEWFNPGCPVVQKHHNAHTMTDTAKKFEGKDVVWLAINSGGQGQQGHGKEANAKARTDWHLGYPVLLDESGTVGRSYGAKTTPHMFVIDKTGTLVYAGAIDNGNPGKVGDVNYVEQAVTQTLAGETVDTPETKPYGCGVKYGRDKQ